jgi:hypothetical protein
VTKAEKILFIRLLLWFRGYMRANTDDPTTLELMDGSTISCHENQDFRNNCRKGGYPPVAVRPEDRKAYLDSLERASRTEDFEPYQTLMHQRLDATLEEYLSALQEALPQPESSRREPPQG